MQVRVERKEEDIGRCGLPACNIREARINLCKKGGVRIPMVYPGFSLHKQRPATCVEYAEFLGRKPRGVRGIYGRPTRQSATGAVLKTAEPEMVFRVRPPSLPPL